MKAKRWMSVWLCAALVMALTGCGANADPAEEGGASQTSAAKVVKLRVWADKEEYDLTTQLADQFQKDNSGTVKLNISVEPKEQDSLRTNVIKDVMAAADVFTIQDSDLMVLAAGGALTQIQESAKVQASADSDAVKAFTNKEKLYAYPSGQEKSYVLFYNKKQIGDGQVKTLEGTLKAAAAKGKKLAMDWSQGQSVYSFFGKTGLNLSLNDDGTTNACNWNSTDHEIKGVTVAGAMGSIAGNKGFANMKEADMVAAAKSGKIAAGIASVETAEAVKKEWGDDFAAAKLPTYSCGGKKMAMSSFLGYRAVAANYYSENKEWALKLAEYLAGEEAQKTRYQELNQLPVNTNVMNSEEAKKDPVIEAVSQQKSMGSLRRVGTGYEEACASFGTKMAGGEKDYQNLLDDLVKGITTSAK